MDDMLKKMLEMVITQGYVEDNETIEDLKNNFYEKLKLKEDVELNYEDLISDYSFKLSLLSEIIRAKKLKNNKEDGLVLVEIIKDVTNDLEQLFIKEVVKSGTITNK